MAAFPFLPRFESRILLALFVAALSDSGFERVEARETAPHPPRTALELFERGRSLTPGPNRFGTLILHSNPDVQFTHDGTSFCDSGGIAICEEALAEASVDGPVVIHVLAAFPDGSAPRLQGVVFGIEYPASITVIEEGRCGDLELPTTEWPASGSGMAVSWASAQTGRLIDVFWIAARIEAGESGTLGLIPHPIQGAYFADDSLPARLDPIVALGVFGFHTAGDVPCPVYYPQAGACCLHNGTCVTTSPDLCAEMQGTYRGDDTECEQILCPRPQGACCIFDGSCVFRDGPGCKDQGGDYVGDDVPCEPNPCPQPPSGACCFVDGSCRHIPEWECSQSHGTYLGDGLPCNPNPCPVPPVGACCSDDGSCNFVPDWTCADIGGIFQGEGVPCQPNPCPQPTVGACCFYTGDCFYIRDYECDNLDGEFQGGGVPCDPSPCPPGGACCVGAMCVVLTESLCDISNGHWVPDRDCNPSPCQNYGACCAESGTCTLLYRYVCLDEGGAFQGHGSDCVPNPCPNPCNGEPRSAGEPVEAPKPAPSSNLFAGRAADVKIDYGPNYGGTLILHSNPNLQYTSDHTEYCGASGLNVCSQAETETSGEDIRVIHAIAAFHPDNEPRLGGITFGIEYGFCVTIADYGACGDFELPTSGWPASGEGTSVTWSVARLDHLVDVYWFAAYGDSLYLHEMRLTPHPTQGGYFADDSIPAVLDPVADYGSFGFNMDGDAPCPVASALIGACCFGDTCAQLPQAKCALDHGRWIGADIPCDPNPCVEVGPCAGAATPPSELASAGLRELRRYEPFQMPELQGGCGVLSMNANGSYEASYSWNYDGVVAPTYGAFAECYAGSGAVCGVVFDFTQIGNQTGQRMDVFIWDDGGGCPGNVMCVRVNANPGAVAYWPEVSRHRTDLDGCCVDGGFWAGFWGAWPGAEAGWMVAADLDGFGGCPSTNVAPGQGLPTGWNTLAGVEALGIGVEMTDCGGTPTRRVTWGNVKALFR